MIKALPYVFALLAAGHATGCAAEPLSPSGAPAAFARPYPLRWQQFCEQVWTVPQASELASTRGNEGWELVTMYNGVLCFKRPWPASAGESVPARAGAPFGPAPQPGYVPAVREPGF